MHPTQPNRARARAGWGLREPRWGNFMADTDTDPIATYRRIAEVLRSAQRVAIEVENAPDKRKRLRTFSFQEVAALLGIKLRDVIAYSKISEGGSVVPRNRLTLNELSNLRRSI